MRMKNIMLAVSTAAVLGLAFFISGCNASRHESPKDAVGLSDVSVGDIVVFGDIRWFVIAKTDDGYTLLSEKPVIRPLRISPSVSVPTIFCSLLITNNV